MCSTPETVRSLSLTGEFNGPNNNPQGTITDAIILRFIGTTQRARRQLILDWGCARTGSNIVPELIDLEVAHWLKLQLMMEGVPGQDPNPPKPPIVGPVSESEIDRAGTKSRLKLAIGNIAPGDILKDEGYLQTYYGQRWFSLWKLLPTEYTSSSPSLDYAPLPVAIYKLGLPT